MLEEAASERITAVIELHSAEEGLVHLVDGEVYLVDVAGAEPLQDRMVRADLLTVEQIERHTEPGDEQAYLALALDTDETIDERAIADWLLDITARTLHRFESNRQGEYEVDPYGSHPAGILASWPVDVVYDRIGRIAAEPGSGSVPDGTDDHAGRAVDDTPLPPPPPPDDDAPPAVDPVLVTPDTVPEALAVVELSPLEWRVVILAARGISQGDLAVRLGLDHETTGGLVEVLCQRDLLTRSGPGV